MEGEKVKRKLKSGGYSLNDIAKAMGETPQNLQSLLKTSDIKTGVLEKIANAINKNIYFFFDDNIVTGDNNMMINGNKNTTNGDTGKFIDLLKEKDKQIDRLITLLENLSKK